MERKLNDQEITRRKKMQELIDMDKNPYAIDSFKTTHSSQQYKDQYEKFSKDELHTNVDEIIVAGRVMAIRQTFGVIKDFYGRLQFYINKKEIEPQLFSLFSNQLDIGDIIGIVGTPMKTNTGEITIKIKNFKILSKALKPLPEKFHGLSDEETRARQRYIDLITNDESLNVFITRSKILKLVREYFDSLNYFEVETPVLQPILGGAAARPFITHHNALDREYYLRIATELPLKKLIVGGFERVYEIGRIFRNEGMDTTHNPEFTTIEAYEAYACMEDMMDRVEGLFRYIANKLNTIVFEYKGVNLDFSKPFRKISMVDFIKQETKIDFLTVTTNEHAQTLAKEHHIELMPHQKTIGHIINAFFEKYCEEKCLQPTFVYGHPLDVSPLAKKDDKNPLFTKRFELFIATKEYANAFAELNDPIDQFERFQSQIKEKSLGNQEANEIDYDFIDALEYGLPPTGGLGVGIDRMIMLFTKSLSIRNVLLFPHMREK